MVEDLHGNGALPGHRAQIVIRRNQGRAGAGDVVECGGRRFVVGSAADDQLDELTAVVADPIAFLFGRLARDIHPAVDLHRAAGQRETLGVVAGRRAHDTGLQLVVGELFEQVVGATHLVGPDALQILALEVDLRAGGRRQSIAELQRGAQCDVGDSLRRRVDIGRGQRT